MRSNGWWWMLPLASLLACQSNEHGLGGPEDGPPAIRATKTPPPVSGGTLLVIEDGAAAVAADPDLDVVHVVDWASGTERHTIELPSGDEPGRLVADAAGRVHVVARHGGAVVDLDPATGAILGRRTVCPNPRGIVYDPGADSLHVACAGGDLVSLAAQGGPAWRRTHVAPDLRDLVLTDEGLVATRFRTARVVHIDADGEALDEEGLPILERSLFSSPGDPLHHMQPNTAWRTVATPDGDWLMLHQVSTNRPLKIEVPAGDGGGDDAGGGDDGGMDGGYGSMEEPCASAVQAVITRGDERASTRSSPLLHGAVLAVDLAVDPDGERVVVALAGQRTDTELPPGAVPDGAHASGVAFVRMTDLTAQTDPGCDMPQPIPVVDGQYVAVAIDPQGRILAQSREPARVVRVDPHDLGDPEVIILSGPSRRDTGHDLFHIDAGAGIACATCHPEGGDDGRIWSFEGLGLRHTPALAVGLKGTEPFHWQGDMGDMQALAHEVHTGRMGGPPLGPEWIDALASWMFAIPSPGRLRAPEDAAVRRGAEAFAAWGCGRCHQGPSLAGNESVDVGVGFDVQVPALRGVALHPPYMHDGRAEDLTAAVWDMLERTYPGEGLPPAEAVSDVVAYLESL